MMIDRVYDYSGTQFHSKEGKYIIFEVRQWFKTIDEFRDAMKDYVSECMYILFIKNDKVWIIATILDKCPWMIYASILSENKISLLRVWTISTHV